MKTFKCWDTEDDEEKYTDRLATGHTIKAFDHEMAATEFAEHCFYGGDPFEEMEVAVQLADGTGPIRTFTIDVDYDPTFSACEVPTPACDSQEGVPDA